MRWILVILLAYAALLLQISLVGLMTIDTESVGAIRPDLLAVVAVFLALNGRGLTDVMIAGWILGLGVDLTVTGGTGTTTVVGPMPIAYSLAAGLIFQIREAFFREWFLTKLILTLLFCLLSHGIWITWQSLAASEVMNWSAYGDLIVQMLLLSLYSALVAPLVQLLLGPLRKVIVPAGPGRSSRHQRA
ncbi:MAG: hypothetical protein ACLFUJ_05640 [Phycisphaerae bacterium]